MIYLIFLAALTIRLAHTWQIRATPFFDILLGDARGYDQWAQRLAAGDWVGTEVFYQAPLYPYFLGAIYAVAGHDLLAVRVAQAALGAGSCALLALAGTRLFGRTAGLIAGFGLAFYAPAIFFDGLLQKSGLDLFFACLSLWLLGRVIDDASSRRDWLALGLALGGLTLTRENAIVFVAVVAVWIVVRGGSGRFSGVPGGSAQHAPAPPRTSQHLILFAVGLALVLLPVVARNYAVGGGFYVTTAQFGPNFYIGNHPGADGTYASLRPGRGAPEYERQDATELAEFALKRRLTPAEVSGYWTDRALAFITGSPGEWLTLMARKAALLVNTSEMLDTESQESYAEVSWPLRLLDGAGHFGVLVPLAALGLWAAWPERRRLWPLCAMLAAYAASVVAFYVFARYRFPLVPFLLLFAAAGLTSLPALARGPDRRQPARVGVAVAIIAVLVNWPMLSEARMRAITETNLGTAFYEAGRMDEAEARYRKAIAMQPDYAPAFNNLGVAQRAQGKVDEAIRTYQEGLLHSGDYPDLHYNMANALIARGRTAEAADHLKRALASAPSSAASHNNLGMALAAEGRLAEAVFEFRAAVVSDPGSALAHRNLGNALANLGSGAEALASLGRAAELAPGDAAARYDYGSLLLEAGRFGAAEAEFRAALQAEPGNVEALNNLGIALANQGRLADALAQFERAVRLRPGFVDAVKNRDRVRQTLRR